MHAKILGTEESSFHFKFGKIFSLESDEKNTESYRKIKLSNLPHEMINGWKITLVESLTTVRYLLYITVISVIYRSLKVR